MRLPLPGKRSPLSDLLLPPVPQYPIDDQFDPTRSSPLERLAPLLRYWLHILATAQISLEDVIDQGRLSPREIQHDWTNNRIHAKALENVIGNLSKGHAVQ